MEKRLEPKLDRLDNEYLSELVESFDHINYFDRLREYDSNWNKYVSQVFKEGAERAKKFKDQLEKDRKEFRKNFNPHERIGSSDLYFPISGESLQGFNL